ncbi:hypothetical protein OSTOST_25963, partial [Ostertagia ostertagi]
SSHTSRAALQVHKSVQHRQSTAELVQKSLKCQLRMEIVKNYAVLRCNILKIPKIPDEQVNQCLEERSQKKKRNISKESSPLPSCVPDQQL